MKDIKFTHNNCNLKVDILLDKISPERNDSFWYSGKDVAKVSLPSGSGLFAEAVGEIRLYFEEDGDVFKNINAVEEALDRNLTDDDLNKIGEFDGWVNNNWFRIIKVNANGDMISDDLAIGGDYDEAIELLIECAKEEYDLEYN
jgi:hypothetical protein